MCNTLLMNYFSIIHGENDIKTVLLGDDFFIGMKAKTNSNF